MSLWIDVYLSIHCLGCAPKSEVKNEISPDEHYLLLVLFFDRFQGLSIVQSLNQMIYLRLVDTMVFLPPFPWVMRMLWEIK